MSELVKIDPANIGVGLYQHDVKAKHLRASLDDVVESCVNYVGVDVNTASPALLRYVSGLNQLTARRLYEYRLRARAVPQPRAVPRRARLRRGDVRPGGRLPEDRRAATTRWTPPGSIRKATSWPAGAGEAARRRRPT